MKVIYLGFLLIILILGACSKELQQARNDPSKVIVRDPKQRPIAISKISDETLRPALIDAVPYSLLSAASYEDDDPRPLQNVCKIPHRYSELWTREIDSSDNPVPLTRSKPFGIKINGLAYSVWVNGNDPSGKVVAVVFRGTDFTQFGDWYSNLRWITRFIPFTWDQYQQTRDLIGPLVAEIQRKHGEDVRIVTAGHSLGGGLAQHAAYSSEHIDDVYAFASSPVTGSSSLDWRIDRSDVYILRSYESGEALAFFRWAARRVIPLSRKDPVVNEARFNFRRSFENGNLSNNPISQHRATRTACDLLCSVDKNLPTSSCS